jgi:enamine deaminase RidA (YjgF/YER057c/UK114 family)
MRCLRVGAFVNAPQGFQQSPKIANGASDIFVALWGEAGRHARTAVGVSALPMDASVEIDAIFEAEEE